MRMFKVCIIPHVYTFRIFIYFWLIDPTQIKYDAKLKIGNGKDDWENIINQAYSKGIVAESDQASYLKNWETKGAKTVTIMNVLSTQGDSSSNGTVANERNRSGVIKTKSNSMSSGSDERNTQKQSIMPAKDTIDSGRVLSN